MALEDLEKELYSPERLKRRKVKIETPRTLPPQMEEPALGWREDVKEEESPAQWEKPASKFKKILGWGSLVTGVVLFGVLGYFIYQAYTFRGIDLTALYPDSVLVGVPFDYNVSYANNTGSILRSAKLVINLPEEMIFMGESSEKRVEEKRIGNIGIDSVGQETFRVMAVGGAKSRKRIGLSLEYIPGNLGSRLEKKADGDISIGDSAASIDLSAAEKVLSGETFEIKLKYKNISSVDLKDLELRFDYPANFIFKTSSLEPDQGNNLWKLGDLRSGSENEIIIQGNIIAAANSFFEIKSSLFSGANGSKYLISDKSAKIFVAPAPLQVDINLNEKEDYVVKSGDSLNYTVSYRNNSDVGFRDVILTAKLSGEMFDFSSLEHSAAFNSITNALTWNASNVSEFTTLEPGRSGSVSFRIGAKQEYPIKRLSDKNFTLKIDAKIESRTVPRDVAAERTVSVEKLENKVSGALSVDAKGFFRDADSGILNKGSVPPKVNQKTNYTIHWVIKNFSTDVENVDVSAFLMPGVRATGVIKSNIDTRPAYNERTQGLTWQIPRIQATRGVISEPVEAVIQVEATPSIDQLNSPMPLIGETTLRAKDSFTGETLEARNSLVDTTVPDDSSVGFENGKVAQ